jgi:hypothetical protein
VLTVQDHIPGAKRRPHWMYETGRDELDLMIELDMMKRVQAAAISLSITGDHEPQWYCSVQWPLLDMAFRDQSHIEPKQMYALCSYLIVVADLQIARPPHQRVSASDRRPVLRIPTRRLRHQSCPAIHLQRLPLGMVEKPTQSPSHSQPISVPPALPISHHDIH